MTTLAVFPKILFSSDALYLNGHDLLALRFACFLQKNGFSCQYECNPENHRARSILKNTGVAALTTALPPRRPRDLLVFLEIPRILQRARWLRNQKLSLAVAVQGEITVSLPFLWAACLAGIPTLAYNPMPHSFYHIRAHAGWFRDQLHRFYYALPDRQVTCCESMGRELKHRGVPSRKIRVVPNSISMQQRKPAAQLDVRRSFWLPCGKKMLGLFGRISFSQKRHLFALEIIQQLEPEFHLLVVGDGPDDKALREAISAKGLNNRVHLIPWQRDPADLYQAIDLLLIPSEYEGFPMVMLESLYWKVPVLAVDRDGMHDFLPHPWKLPPSDGPFEWAGRIRGILANTDPCLLREMQSRVKELHLMPVSEEAFMEVVREILDN